MNFVMFLSEQNKKEKYERDKTHKQKIINCRGGGGATEKRNKTKNGTRWEETERWIACQFRLDRIVL